MGGAGKGHGHLPQRLGRPRRQHPGLPIPTPVLPLPAPQPHARSTLDPPAQRRFRDLQEERRLGI